MKDLSIERADTEGHYEFGLRLTIDEQREYGDKKWAEWADGLLNAKDIVVDRLEAMVTKLRGALLNSECICRDPRSGQTTFNCQMCKDRQEALEESAP